jgi:PKD repeat protein
MKLQKLLFYLIATIMVGSCSKSVPAPAPVASFTWTASSTTAPSVVSFTNTSTNATTYSWDFGNGSTSTAASPSHTFSNAGSFIVKLTVTGAGGTNSTTQTVNIAAPTALEITIKDNLGNAVSGATVKLYSSLTDWTNGTNQLLTTLTTNASGVVKFSPLSAIKYFWYVNSGCRNNFLGGSTTTNALTANITNTVTTIIDGTGTLVVNNTSTNPYDVYINSVLQVASMAGGTSRQFTAPVGTYVIRVVQKSGFLVFPTDKSYNANLTCGGTVTTTFP